MGGGLWEGEGADVSPMWDRSGERGGSADAFVQRKGGAGLGCAAGSLWALGTQSPACQRVALWSLKRLHAVYQPLGETAKPCRGNAVFLLSLTVCGSGTWEGLWLLLHEHFQLGRFCFHPAAGFLRRTRKKYLPWWYYSPKPSFHQI